MSVLIRDLEIPINCSECPVALSGKYCRINKTYTTYITLPMRPEHCPLVELPERHGRLIDADNLKERFGEKFLYSYDYIVGIIDDEPVVVQSE